MNKNIPFPTVFKQTVLLQQSTPKEFWQSMHPKARLQPPPWTRPSNKKWIEFYPHPLGQTIPTSTPTEALLIKMIYLVTIQDFQGDWLHIIFLGCAICIAVGSLIRLRAWVENLRQRVPITRKSSNFKGETHYVVKLPKSTGARQYCPKLQRVPGTLVTRANSSPEPVHNLCCCIVN